MAETPLRQRLREALPAAMKSRDRVAVAALRATLSAIDNAEAVKTEEGTRQSLAIEDLPVGAGATEAARRHLTDEDVAGIVRAEVAERESAAAAYDRSGHPDRAGQLRGEAQVLVAHLAI
jgi:uncharacterized protein